jgi:glycosyltransferase involved in cell wall biosynthesis
MRCAVLATLAVFIPAAALAQGADTPNRKITMIVGFAPGGGVDVLARVLAQELNDNAGYQAVIENRPGAGSNIAAKIVAGAPPDGATVLFTGNSYAINQTIYRNPGYATADLRPVDDGDEPHAADDLPPRRRVARRARRFAVRVDFLQLRAGDPRMLVRRVRVGRHPQRRPRREHEQQPEEMEQVEPNATHSEEPERQRSCAVGRVLPHKGLEITISALPETWHLNVIGPFGDDAYLRYLRGVARDKDVRFLGPVSEESRRSHLREALCLITSSCHETYDGQLVAQAELVIASV